jgi:NAD(P)H-dependent FMN reductase
MQLVGICGSLQSSSKNRSLLEAAARCLPVGVNLTVVEVWSRLPPFNPELEESAPLQEVDAWRKAVGQADGLLIACPEYGHSLPGALKNAIDWLIGSGELDAKPVAITAAVPLLERGLLGLEALRVTLNAVRVDLVWNSPIIHTEPERSSALIRLFSALVSAAQNSAER